MRKSLILILAITIVFSLTYKFSDFNTIGSTAEKNEKHLVKSLSNSPLDFKITNIRQISQAFDAILLEISFQYTPGKGKGREIIQVVDEVNDIWSPKYILKKGQKKLRILLHKNRATTPVTNSITIKIYKSKRLHEKLSIREDIKLDWKIKQIKKYNNIVDAASVSSVFIPVSLENYISLRNTFVKMGVSESIIAATGPAKAMYGNDKNIRIDVAGEVNIDMLKSLVKNISPFINIKSIEFVEGRVRKSSLQQSIQLQPVLKTAPQKIDLAIINKSDLSNAQFLKAIGQRVLSKEEKIEELYQDAYTLLDTNEEKNLKIAKLKLDKLLSLTSNYPRAYLELARYYIKSSNYRNFDEAIKKAERSILVAKKLDPELADTRILLGYVYTLQEKFADAEAEYKIAQAKDSSNLWLYANWGLNFEQQNSLDQAISMYKKVMDSPRAWDKNERAQEWTKHRIFPLMLKQQQFLEMDELYNKVIADFPGDKCLPVSQATNRLYYLNDYNAALNSLSNATQKGCTTETPLLSIAYYMKWLDSFKETNMDDESLYNKAESLSPSDAVLLFALGISEPTSNLIPYLLKRGRLIDSENSEGLTSLTLAISSQNLEASERLLKYGANVNHKSKKLAYTPLMISIAVGNENLVKLLLRYGADISKRLPNGQTLEDFSTQKGLDSIAKLVRYHINT